MSLYDWIVDGSASAHLIGVWGGGIVAFLLGAVGGGLVGAVWRGRVGVAAAYGALTLPLVAHTVVAVPSWGLTALVMGGLWADSLSGGHGGGMLFDPSIDPTTGAFVTAYAALGLVASLLSVAGCGIGAASRWTAARRTAQSCIVAAIATSVTHHALWVLAASQEFWHSRNLTAPVRGVDPTALQLASGSAVFVDLVALLLLITWMPALAPLTPADAEAEE